MPVQHEFSGAMPRTVAFALSLRFVLAVAVIGMAVGALLMFWEGGLEIWGAVHYSFGGESATSSVITEVMEATDKFLFGIVLVIFGFTVSFGFLVDLPPPARAALPRWIAPGGVGEMKRVFFEVILVYLAVNFVTDIARADAHREWTELVMPGAILLLAGAMRLLAGGHGAPSNP